MKIGKQSKYFWIKLAINCTGLAVMAVPFAGGMNAATYPYFIAAGGGFVLAARVIVMILEARAGKK
ncbi:MAG: hypothetical protein A2Y33_12640 [Spirochaetes bacterium GWF1_51_8]|nr:MAG: hypothetical protein A2Y33_12640 [Spirochaetes bacterium GWF1_51_8]